MVYQTLCRVQEKPLFQIGCQIFYQVTRTHLLSSSTTKICQISCF